MLARQLRISVVPYSRPLFVRYGYMQGACPERDEAPSLQANRSGWTWTARVAPSLYQWTRLALQSARFPPPWRLTAFSGLTDTGPVRGADVTWRMAAQTAGPGFFLVGDAACVLDPASSPGVLKAMMSGMMAVHLGG